MSSNTDSTVGKAELEKQLMKLMQQKNAVDKEKDRKLKQIDDKYFKMWCALDDKQNELLREAEKLGIKLFA